MDKIDLPLAIKMIFCGFLAIEGIIMVTIWLENNTDRATFITAFELLACIVGVAYVWLSTHKRHMWGKQNLIILCIFFVCLALRIITLVLVWKFSKTQIQECYIDQSTKKNLYRINAVDLIFSATILFHYFKHGPKEIGRRLNEIQ